MMPLVNMPVEFLLYSLSTILCTYYCIKEFDSIYKDTKQLIKYNNKNISNTSIYIRTCISIIIVSITPVLNTLQAYFYLKKYREKK